MIYEKATPKSTPYSSVNQLIQPKKKYSGLSVMPPYAAGVQTKLMTAGQAPVAVDPAAELVVSPETEAENVPLSETGITAEQTKAPEKAAEPEGSAWSVEQQSAPLAESVDIKENSFVLAESASDAEAKAEPSQTKAAPQSEILQPKSKAANAAIGSATPAALDQGANFNKSVAPNQGEPLPEPLQQQMEDVLGMDFNRVRLHRDPQSATRAANLGAKAFASGEHIYFNQGEYNPGTTAGRQLIAHELAHVRQQRTIPGLQYRLAEPAARDRYEQEADAVADQVVGSERANPLQVSAAAESASLITGAAGVQCKDEGGGSWILRKVGELLRNIPGYDILTLVIGRDPLTGQAVKRDGFALVKAIVGLIPGGKMIFDNLEKTKIIPKTLTWFKDEFKKLNLSFATIKQLFSQAWDSLSLWDLASPGKAFDKVKNIFAAPVKRMMNFIASAGPKMAEFVFEGALTVAGAPVKMIMGVLNQGKNVLKQIFHDPVGFLKNLINAVKGGLGKFVGNITTHLQNGIGGWLFGALGKAGLVMPEKLNLGGIFSLVAQVLGVTWQAIRAIVVKRLGPAGEKVMGQVEHSVAFVGQLITKGPLAILEMAQEFIGELPGLFFGSLIEWVRNTIIVKAVQKLISMFNPVGAIIQAVITIYNVVQFFIERAKQIAALVGAVFNSIAEIAGGNIGKAMAAVENALAKALPVTISFLASLIGLGGIAAKIKEIIRKIRKPIEKVVGKVVGFVVGKAKALLAKVANVGKGVVGGIKDWWKTRKEFVNADGEKHTLFFQGEGISAKLMIASEVTEAIKYLQSDDVKDSSENKPLIQKAGQLIGKIIAIGEKLPNGKNAKDATPEQEKQFTEQQNALEELKNTMALIHDSQNGDRPEELNGKSTPTLDKLEKFEPGVSKRYINDFKTKYKGIQEIVQYVEQRAARKLGRTVEPNAIAAYIKATGTSGLSKIPIEVFDSSKMEGTPRLRIPDIFKENIVVGDVKNVASISLDAQMQDNVNITNGFARFPGTNQKVKARKFDLVVRASKDGNVEGTHVSKPLLEAIDASGGKIYELI